MGDTTFISFFSGIGGFDLGFERADFRCVAQVEKDKAARTVLARHFPNVLRLEDIRDVRSTDLPTADVWCGGFPCQDVSIAGDRAGLAGKRSGLWFEFLRLIREACPRFVVIENVPGLLSSNRGRDFATILQGLVECGYRVVWRVLDAQHFGLAQRRKRVFIVASLGDGRAAEILFESQSVRGGAQSSRAEREGIAATIGASAPSRRNGGSSPTAGHLVAGTLAASGAGTARPAGQKNEADMLIYFGFRRSDEYVDAEVASPLAARDYKFARDLVIAEAVDVRNFGSNGEISGTLQSKGRGGYSLNHQNPIAFNGKISAASNRVDPVRRGDYSGTVEAGRQDAVLLNGGVRRLTPLECERLQGFPDGWTEYIQDSGQCVIIGEWLKHFARLKDVLVPSLIGRGESALCTISDSKDTELSIYQLGTIPPLNDAQSVIGWLVNMERGDTVPDTTNHGNDMVIRCNLNGTPQQEPHKPSEEGDTTALQLRLLLEDRYSPERLSTISTWMRQMTPLLISTFAKMPPNTVEFTLRWNEPRPNSSRSDFWCLKTVNIKQQSDSARYRQLGNAVAVPVAEWIGRRIVECR